MTPNARKIHIGKLKDLLRSYGYVEDRWGNFVHPSAPKERFKFKKVNLRLEVKIDKRWCSGGLSLVISKIELDQFSRYLKAKVQGYEPPKPKVDVKELKRQRYHLKNEAVEAMITMYYDGQLPSDYHPIVQDILKLNEQIKEAKKR